MARFEERIAGVSSGSGGGSEDTSYRPQWFRRQIDETSQEVSYQYTNEYWECKSKQDWSRCPDIF
ncbi:oxysterol-binding protein 1 [Diaphorina citri]|uniref:Oxysterol-binding protein 1 n=1 Tax=Diaphorina citri TaxID=121845 RepID=A0A1S3DJC3_DIACI|nr:oxysterol-binding protein 1 [Diaphorina citri]